MTFSILPCARLISLLRIIEDDVYALAARMLQISNVRNYMTQ